jgi:hypothetical protein
VNKNTVEEQKKGRSVLESELQKPFLSLSGHKSREKEGEGAWRMVDFSSKVRTSLEKFPPSL